MRTWWAGAVVLLAGAAPGLTVPFAAPASADPPVCTGTSCSFVSPNGSIDCQINFQNPAGTPDGAFCSWSDEQRAQTVRLLPSGVLEPCINPVPDLVDRCKTDPLTAAPALGYGQSAVLGPFDCVAGARDVTCHAMPSGRGFSISSTGILPVQAPVPPAPPPVEPAPDAAVPPPDASPAPALEPPPVLPLEAPAVPVQ